MRFSLVLATRDRVAEVERFLRSLSTQDEESFELIVVDQNSDNRLESILKPYRKQFPIHHLHSSPGLSRARNKGLEHANHEIIAFPDDDCWYPPKLLSSIRLIFQKHESLDGVTGRMLDESGAAYTDHLRETGGPIDLFNVWTSAVSSAIFFRREVVSKVATFDESLGVGAGTAFGSGEETDFMIRALQAGFYFEFYPEIVVHHPNADRAIDTAAIDKAYRYGCGLGRVLAKHRYPVWFKARALLFPLIGALLQLIRFRTTQSKLHWNRFRGRLRGLLS